MPKPTPGTVDQMAAAAFRAVAKDVLEKAFVEMAREAMRRVITGHVEMQLLILRAYLEALRGTASACPATPPR